MNAPNARTQEIERLVSRIAAIPLMSEAVFHSLQYQDGKVEKEVCDVLLLHQNEAILLSIKAQEKVRDVSTTKKWVRKYASKALAQLGGAYRTLGERPMWGQHRIWGRKEFRAGSVTPRHGVALLESRFEITVDIEEWRIGDVSADIPTSLMSIDDFFHLIHYLRTWQDLLKYLDSRNACLRFPDCATIGAEVALLGYYTAMRDTFDGCAGIPDAKIVTAGGRHVRPDSAFRDKEAALASVLEDFIRGIAEAGDMPLPAALECSQSRGLFTSLNRDAVREEFCDLTVQERAALGEQIGVLCKRMVDENSTDPLYAGLRLSRRSDRVYVVVVGSDPDHAGLSVQARDVLIAACVYHERHTGIVLMLNQSSDGLKFGIGRVENVEPSIEMIAAGHEYFGHVRPRKIEKAR